MNSNIFKLEEQDKPEKKSPGWPYQLAPEVERLAKELIAKHYPYLSGIEIAYLYRVDKWVKRGKMVRGFAKIVPPALRLIAGCELAIIVNRSAFVSFEEEGKIAVVDNLLAYYEQPVKNSADQRTWSKREPDICEFSEVVIRNNICMSNLNALTSERTEQLSIYHLADKVADHKMLSKTTCPVVIDEEENNFIEDYEEAIKNDPGRGDELAERDIK